MKKVRLLLLCMVATLILGGCQKNQKLQEAQNEQEAQVEQEAQNEQEAQVEQEKQEEQEMQDAQEVQKDEGLQEAGMQEGKDHSTCKLEGVFQTEDGKNIAVFDGTEHDFILDLPEKASGAPLVLMLHGYGESAEGFLQKTGFSQAGTEAGYAVAYIAGAPSKEDATSATGWNSGIGVSSNKDVEFLCAFANDMCETYSLDSTRVYAVGFSNGAFMAHRLALEANDLFSGVVCVAGMMPESIWANKPDTCEISVFQITGEKDDVVPKNSDGSARYAKAPAIEDVMAYYVEKNALTLSETAVVGKKSNLEKYTSDGSKKQVWNLFIPDGRHSWPDEGIVGFELNALILEFFAANA